MFYAYYAGFVGDNCNYQATEVCAAVYRSRAVTCAVLSLVLLYNAYNCRNSRLHLWQLPFFGNKRIVIGMGISVVLLVVAIYVPTLNNVVFRMRMIDWEWAVIAVAVVSYIILTQSYKAIKNVTHPVVHISGIPAQL